MHHHSLSPKCKPRPRSDPQPYNPHANQACRIWFKLHTKYGMDVSKVTDCARISLEFATAEGLERAATFVLQAASTFKNRVANPTDEGYRDLMFTVLIGGHVCEVFAAPPPPGCPAALQRTTALHGVGAWPAALHSACAHASALGGRQGRGGGAPRTCSLGNICTGRQKTKILTYI